MKSIILTQSVGIPLINTKPNGQWDYKPLRTKSSIGKAQPDNNKQRAKDSAGQSAHSKQ